MVILLSLFDFKLKIDRQVQMLTFSSYAFLVMMTMSKSKHTYISSTILKPGSILVPLTTDFWQNIDWLSNLPIVCDDKARQ